jgi:hypothetical protein
MPSATVTAAGKTTSATRRVPTPTGNYARTACTRRVSRRTGPAILLVVITGSAPTWERRGGEPAGLYHMREARLAQRQRRNGDVGVMIAPPPMNVVTVCPKCRSANVYRLTEIPRWWTRRPAVCLDCFHVFAPGSPSNSLGHTDPGTNDEPTGFDIWPAGSRDAAATSGLKSDPT